MHIPLCNREIISEIFRPLFYQILSAWQYNRVMGWLDGDITMRSKTIGRPAGGCDGDSDLALLALNALFLGTGVFANLGFEEIGLDLYVIALLAVISTYLLWRDED